MELCGYYRGRTFIAAVESSLLSQICKLRRFTGRTRFTHLTGSGREPFAPSACISGPHVLDVPNSTPPVSAPSISAAIIEILSGRKGWICLLWLWYCVLPVSLREKIA